MSHPGDYLLNRDLGWNPYYHVHSIQTQNQPDNAKTQLSTEEILHTVVGLLTYRAVQYSIPVLRIPK